LIISVLFVCLISLTVHAGYDAGVSAYRKGDFAAAIREFKPLAYQGRAAAQFYVGLMYYNGQGMKQDHTQAAVWFRKAAGRGHTQAQRYLGIMYLYGQGVAQDYGQAADWYRTSAEQGDAVALSHPWVDGRGYANLAAAVAAMTDTEATFIVSTPQSLGANLTIPSNITLVILEEGLVTVAAGATLLVSGEIRAGNRQVFAGAGPVAFGGGTVVYPEWFGAKGDGITDDRSAIQKTVNSLTLGGTIRFYPKTYLVTSYTSGTSHFVLISRSNIHFDGNQAVLRSTGTAGSVLFDINSCNGIAFDALTIRGNFERAGSVVSKYSIGAFMVRSSLSSSKQLSFTNMTVLDCFYLLICSKDLAKENRAYRISQIVVENVHCKNGYYGINFQNNGDNTRIRDFSTSAYIRSYFVYGVTGHDVVYTSNGGDVFSDCLIKTYNRDTSDLRVTAIILNNTSTYSPIAFESEHDPTAQPVPCRIYNIDLTLDEIGHKYGGQPAIRFAYHRDTAGVAKESATSATNIFDNIRIRGRILTNISVAVKQGVPGALDLSQLTFADVVNNQAPYLNGFYRKSRSK
jgi:hypothetical protein